MYEIPSPFHPILEALPTSQTLPYIQTRITDKARYFTYILSLSQLHTFFPPLSPRQTKERRIKTSTHCPSSYSSPTTTPYYSLLWSLRLNLHEASYTTTTTTTASVFLQLQSVLVLVYQGLEIQKTKETCLSLSRPSPPTTPSPRTSQILSGIYSTPTWTLQANSPFPALTSTTSTNSCPSRL